VVPFKRLRTVFYSPSIVTMAVFVAVCELFSVRVVCPLKQGYGSFKVIGNGTIG